MSQTFWNRHEETIKWSTAIEEIKHLLDFAIQHCLHTALLDVPQSLLARLRVRATFQESRCFVRNDYRWAESLKCVLKVRLADRISFGEVTQKIAHPAHLVRGVWKGVVGPIGNDFSEQVGGRQFLAVAPAHSLDERSYRRLFRHKNVCIEIQAHFANLGRNCQDRRATFALEGRHYCLMAHSPMIKLEPAVVAVNWERLAHPISRRLLGAANLIHHPKNALVVFQRVKDDLLSSYPTVDSFDFVSRVVRNRFQFVGPLVIDRESALFGQLSAPLSRQRGGHAEHRHIKLLKKLLERRKQASIKAVHFVYDDCGVSQ